MDAVDEMMVLSNAFSAEYGGSTGSVVNIVTASGGNRYHGGVLCLNRPSATEAALSGFTAANAASSADLTNDTLNQGAVIGRRRKLPAFVLIGAALAAAAALLGPILVAVHEAIECLIA